MNQTTSRTVLAAVAVALGSPAFANDLALNEIYASHTGTDDQEFIELVGPAGASLDNVMVLVVEGEDASAFGTLDRAWDLTGLAVPGDGYFVLGDTAVATLDYDIGASNAIENGTETVYLFLANDPAAIAALVGTDLDPEDDDTTILPTLGTILDRVTITEADPLDHTFDDAAKVGPDGTFFPAGIFRDGDYPNPWCSQSFLDFDPFVNLAEPSTPGSTNSPCASTETVIYCTAGTSASGCQAMLWSAGVPSATATSGFYLTAGCVEGQKDGLFFFGANGRQANAWGTGTSFQCVVPPVKRAGLLTGSGTTGACDGYFNQDLNARWAAKPAQNPGVAAVVQAQLWYRDPLNTSNQTTSLSNAVEFTVLP